MAFDFEDVLPTVQRAHSLANRDDAEEAVQTAVAEMLARGEPLKAAFVVQKARNRLTNALKRRERGNASLEAYLETDEDEAPVEVAVDKVDFDSHMELREASDNPVLRLRLEAAQAGYSVKLLPRGNHNSRTKYDDHVVAEVRRLRAGGMAYPALAEATGIPRPTLEKWCRRESRRANSAPGWSIELIVEAIVAFVRLEGRRPTISDLQDNPALPCWHTVYEHFGKPEPWLRALALAGVEVSRPETRKWTDDRVEQGILEFAEREGRMPRDRDWRASNNLPGPSKLSKYYRTQCAETILSIIRDRAMAST